MMATAKATNSMAGTMEPDDGFYNEAIDLDHAWMKHFIPGKVFDQTPNTNDQEGGSAGGHHEQIPKIESLDFHQSEQLMVSVTTDAAIRIYNTRLGQQVKSFFSTKYGASAVQFAHHPNCIIYASSRNNPAENDEVNNAIRYHSLYDNTYIRYFKAHQDQVLHLSMSHVSDRFLSSSKDKYVMLWDLKSDKCQHRFQPNERSCLRPCVALDPMDRCFAVGLDGGGIKLYDMRNFNAFHTIHGNRELKISSPPVSQLKFSNDGNWIAASVQEFIYVYDIKPGGKMDAEKPTYTFKTGSAGKQEFCFTPNDKYLLSGCHVSGDDSEDKSIRIWSMENDGDGDDKVVTDLPLHTHNGHWDVPSCIKWGPKTALFATGCHKAVLWVPGEEIAEGTDKMVA